MAEVNDDVIDDVTDVTDDNNTTGLDDETAKALKHFGIDPDNVDNAQVDDLIKVAMRWYKAEQKAISEKREKKEAPKSELPSDVMTKADYALEKFLDKNPELADYTKELKEYQDKKLSLDEAKVLILNSDKARVNREKVNSLGLSDWETSKERSTITKAELAKIAEKDPKEYNRLRDLMDSGKLSMR